MYYCILCLKQIKNKSINIHNVIKDDSDLLIGDLIRIHFTFGEVRDKKFKNKNSLKNFYLQPSEDFNRDPKRRALLQMSRTNR